MNRVVDGIEIVEVVVKCRVPRDEVEEHVIRMRRGEEQLPVPAGLRCRDAFDCHETEDPELATIRAGYW
jgi:hypothetical protein